MFRFQKLKLWHLNENLGHQWPNEADEHTYLIFGNFYFPWSVICLDLLYQLLQTIYSRQYIMIVNMTWFDKNDHSKLFGSRMIQVSNTRIADKNVTKKKTTFLMHPDKEHML